MNNSTSPSSGVSRRQLLQGMGAALAVAALPAPTRAQGGEGEGAGGPPVDDRVMARLAAYMAAAADQDIPDAAAEKGKHHILDTIAAMVSGCELPPAVLALKFARAHAGEPRCTVVGTNVLAGPLEAALVNGTLAQSDETDDSHAPGHAHPGCAIVAAALSAGEQYGVSGSRFLRSVVLGYDVGTRVTMALGGLPFQMRTHRSTHSIAANFGSAAAAGCAAALTAQQMRWLLDFSAQQTGGTAAWMRDAEHVSKSLLFGGFSARNGVTAAVLVQLGGTGVENILSGPDNFLLGNSATAKPEKIVDRLGERFEVTRTNIKKWTVGSPIQAPLDALVNLRQRRPFEVDDLRQVVVRVASSEAKTVNNRSIADICMQHMVALMLVEKTVTFAASHDQALMHDPRILRARAKVQLVPDEELERLYPQRQSIVELTFNDGSMEKERVTAVRGSAENPMTRGEVADKARSLMTPYLGAAQTGRLVDALLHLERVHDLRELRPLLQRT